MRVGNHEGKGRRARKTPGDQEKKKVAVAVIFSTSLLLLVPLNIQKLLPSNNDVADTIHNHNFFLSTPEGARWTTRTACCLLWRVPRVCELFVSVDLVVERYGRE